MAADATASIRNNPNVVKYLARRRRRLFQVVELETDDILNDLRSVAEANILDYVDVLDDGSFKANLRKVDREKGRCIQELSYDAQGRPKIRLKDSLKADELLAKIKKMFEVDSEKEKEYGERLFETDFLDKLIREAKITVNSITVNQLQTTTEDITEESRRMLPERVPTTPQVIEATP